MKISKPADIARLVKRGRQAKGHTQQTVADAAGITRQSLARIERGHGGVSFDTLILILDHLGIRLDGTPVEEAGSGDIAAAAFTQAALRQLQPSFDAATASARDSLVKTLATANLTAPLQRSLGHINDDASRALLRSTIEAGRPASHVTGGEPAPALPEIDHRGGR